MSQSAPYEIRLSLLHLANSILSDKNEKTCEELRENYRSKYEHAIANNSWQRPEFPTLPNVNAKDILAVAQELNTFINKG